MVFSNSSNGKGRTTSHVNMSFLGYTSIPEACRCKSQFINAKPALGTCLGHPCPSAFVLVLSVSLLPLKKGRKFGRIVVKELSKLKEAEMPVPPRENVYKASVACALVRHHTQDHLICTHKIFALGKLMAQTCSHMPEMLRSSLFTCRSITFHTSAFPLFRKFVGVSSGKLCLFQSQLNPMAESLSSATNHVRSLRSAASAPSQGS